MSKYARDTKKYKGCAYGRAYSEENKYGFKVGEEVTDFVAKKVPYGNMAARYRILHFGVRSSLYLKWKTCSRKVITRDLFNRPVCAAHAELALLKVRHEIKEANRLIKWYHELADEAQVVELKIKEALRSAH